ncbi:MAG: peptidyl-prolyl cis-trans isomerase [Bacteroidales bacterium]|nr:peptidyl-prolyl cis-trans isomerase [Bacteroidales bacterium]
MKVFKYLFISLALCVACSSSKESEDEVLAKTESQVLLKKDVLEALPISLSPEDSIAFIKSYVDEWLHVNVLYEKANDNIFDADGQIADQVEKFRKELYINAYEQLFLQQKLDTLIPQSEIDAYYEKHKNEYVLSAPVVKPTLIVFPVQKQADIAEVEKLFFSKKADAVDELKDYCFVHCQKFSFANQWVALSSLTQELPLDIRNESLQVGKNVKLQDSLNVYFVRIEEQLNAGNRMPIELAHDNIAKIILQSRKVELLKTMRSKVFQEAEHKKQFEVFN